MDTEDFLAACLRNPVNDAIADELFRLALPDAWIVSGCLVQTVWNVLTSRPINHGINDYDIFYFDTDTSWQAEDAIIRELRSRLEKPDVKIEVRNQARVSGIRKNMGCRIRHCDLQRKASTASWPKIPRSESAAAMAVTRSMRRMDSTMSPT